MAFLEQHIDVLDEDCKRRMHINPLRVLDTKNPDVQAVLGDAPRLSEYLGEAIKATFAWRKSLTLLVSNTKLTSVHVA